MKMKKNQFYVFNVKLQSEKEGIERIQAYDDLYNSLISIQRYSKVDKIYAVTIYNQHARELDGLKYYYGTLGKGISFFDKDEIRILDKEDMTKEANKKERIIEPVTGEYIFIPAIHRFALLKQPNSINAGDFNKFLDEHLHKLKSKSDVLVIELEKETSIIEEIFNARSVYSLSYEISYSNNDALGAQGDLFDKLLKKNSIGKLSVAAQSNHSDNGMDIKNVNFLGGGLEVAKKNGTIRTAKIKPLNSDKVKFVSNKDKPSLQTFETDNTDIISTKWFHRLLKIYYKHV